MNLPLPIDDAFEPHHASSPTDRFIYEMQIYGHHPFQDEPDPRPLPEEPVVQTSLTAIADRRPPLTGDGHNRQRLCGNGGTPQLPCRAS